MWVPRAESDPRGPPGTRGPAYIYIPPKVIIALPCVSAFDPAFAAAWKSATITSHRGRLGNVSRYLEIGEVEYLREMADLAGSALASGAGLLDHVADRLEWREGH